MRIKRISSSSCMVFLRPGLGLDSNYWGCPISRSSHSECSASSTVSSLKLFSVTCVMRSCLSESILLADSSQRLRSVGAKNAAVGLDESAQALDLTAIVLRTRGRALGYVVLRAELGLIEHFHKAAGKINVKEFRTGHDGTELEGLTIQCR